MPMDTEYLLTVKDPGKKKPSSENSSVLSWSFRFQRWMRKFRIIDRNNDHYLEKVIDPETKEVVHYSDEKLSEHTSHGSAKKRSV